MNDKSLPPQRNRRKWLIYTIAAFAVLAVLFPFVLEFYLQRKLPDLVNDKTPYTVKISGFKLSLMSGNITVNQLKIATKDPNNKNITQIQGTAGQVKITDFGIFKALFKKSYHADQLLVSDGNIKIKTAAAKKKEKKEKKKIDLAVNNLAIKNVTADVEDANGKPIFKGENIVISLKNITQSSNEAKIPLAFTDPKIEGSHIKIGVNEFYEIHSEQVKAVKKSLKLSQFRLKPIQDPKKYNSKNIFDFSAKEFTADDFNISQDSLIVSKVFFSEPDLKVTSTGKQVVEKNKNPKEIEMKIGMKNIFFENGKITVLQQDLEKTASVDHFNFKLNDIVFDKNTVKEKIPFRFTNHDIEADHIYFKANPSQAIEVAKITSKNSDIFIEDFKMLALHKNAAKDAVSASARQIRLLKNKSRYIGQKLNVDFAGIVIERPDIAISSAGKKKPAKKKNTDTPEFAAKVGFIQITNGKFSQSVQNKKKMSVGSFDVKLDGIYSDQKILSGQIPFTVRKRDIKAKQIHLDAGKYYNFSVAGITNAGKTTEMSDIRFTPKYSRKAFSRVIAKETDLYTIAAKKIRVEDHQSSFGKNTVIDISRVDIDRLDCNIYHDLAPPDDNAIRYFFSKKLRDVKVPLFIKNVSLRNSELTYEENAENSNIPGKITFNRFNAQITNVNNAKIKGRPTVINTDAQFDFFGTADTKVNWRFDVKDHSDYFTIKGDIRKLSAENVNLFVRPYLNVTLDGQIDYLKFDYYGNSSGINGKFYFKYNDMYVNLLNKKGKERKLLTKIANWFVKDDSKGEPEHVVIEKKRDPERSFFNMLWQGIMEGLKKYII
ncbi:hypothetical protein QE422_002134 [Chryseobacterium sp. SORGH_AS 447]|uniref:hypothetical protein n=1 Tax=Chryseobacterium sp. SORGH_AS_0447 TaxID=3041769 RepID=UPI00278695B2|nr:hypothetical protein [Chryseobacterium sp. SORGH_AS_0447]MDQ1161766.1 hypothetical protein [Chryseobacterium sp. SORGH_AS_0447]